MAFSLPFYVKLGKLFVNCLVNPSTNKTGWMYLKSDGSLSKQIPQCNYLCDKDPFNDDKVYNRTWITGSLTVGTKASYICAGNQFKLETFKMCF